MAPHFAHITSQAIAGSSENPRRIDMAQKIQAPMGRRQPCRLACSAGPRRHQGLQAWLPFSI